MLSSIARAGVYIEPYIGYGLGDESGNDTKDKLTTTAPLNL